jgi:beta-aspartyl-peptidase (threonine type)
MEHKRIGVKEAADEVVLKKLANLQGSGGVIAMDARKNMAMSFITVNGMKRGYLDSSGKPVVLICKDR